MVAAGANLAITTTQLTPRDLYDYVKDKSADTKQRVEDFLREHDLKTHPISAIDIAKIMGLDEIANYLSSLHDSTPKLSVGLGV